MEKTRALDPAEHDVESDAASPAPGAPAPSSEESPSTSTDETKPAPDNAGPWITDPWGVALAAGIGAAGGAGLAVAISVGAIGLITLGLGPAVAFAAVAVAAATFTLPGFGAGIGSYVGTDDLITAILIGVSTFAGIAVTGGVVGVGFLGLAGLASATGNLLVFVGLIIAGVSLGAITSLLAVVPAAAVSGYVFAPRPLADADVE